MKTNEEIQYPDLSGKTVLVAEDDKTSFALLKTILKRCKMNIIWAKTGREAIEKATSEEAIDLILMDIKMPDINGLEATNTIKEQRPDLPIIAQTAFALSGDEQLTYDAGCDAYVPKPIDKKTLLKEIKQIFHV